MNGGFCVVNVRTSNFVVNVSDYQKQKFIFLLNTFQILQSTAINEYKIESFKILPPSVK